jgi:threonine dehydratase
VNPIRSFKGRGADWFVQGLEPRVCRLVTASAGNFGQGMAWAAGRRGITCDVFAAGNANPLKLERMRALGATVHLAGRDFDEAKSAARRWGASEGVPFVEDGREAAIAEGAGSIGVELAGWPEPFETVLVPLGNGALIGGIGAWLKAVSPETRVIGVCAVGAPAMRDSLRAGRPIETDRVDTIADGIAVRVPVPESLDYLSSVVDDVVLVSDDAMREAMDLVLAETGLGSEPAGVAGLAALLEHPDLRGGLVATPLCGSNAARPPDGR